MSNMKKFSVLMSVYYKEKPEYLDIALNSILNQTLMPDEILIVKNGKLPNELNEIINKYNKLYPTKLKILSWEINQPLGYALKIGVENCSHEYIARMDSDDIARKDRFEKQVEFLINNPQIDIVGSSISEFEDNPKKILSYRVLPEKQQEIYKFAQFRCPMNHQTVMFKKEAVLKVGNYIPFKDIDDYYLWGRMLKNGAIFANIKDCLVNARAGNAMFKRRANLTYFFNNEMPLQIEFLKIGFINWLQFLRNIFLKFLLRALPTKLMGLYYNKFLRKKGV